MTMIYAGIDSGSRSVKVAIYDADSSSVIDCAWADQSIDQLGIARRLFDGLLEKCDIAHDDVQGIVATGYARRMIDFADRCLTEITCHARGVHYYFPDVRSIIEIGGQDSKLIHLDDDGCVCDFAMNDRCAAGTGRFLEMVATRMEVPLSSLSSLVSQSSRKMNISNMCVVFAETEIIALLAEKVFPGDIARGVLHAVASRVISMSPDELKEPVVFTGGVAEISAMREVFCIESKKKIIVPELPQMTGAVGAAILAAKDYDEKRNAEKSSVCRCDTQG